MRPLFRPYTGHSNTLLPPSSGHAAPPACLARVCPSAVLRTLLSGLQEIFLWSDNQNKKKTQHLFFGRMQGYEGRSPRGGFRGGFTRTPGRYRQGGGYREGNAEGTRSNIIAQETT